MEMTHVGVHLLKRGICRIFIPYRAIMGHVMQNSVKLETINCSLIYKE